MANKKQIQTKVFIILLLCCGMKTYAQDNEQHVAINHIAIHVTNLKQSADFYKNVIGLDTIPEPFKMGRHAWFKIGTHTSLHIIAGAPERKEYYLDNHMCFSVTSFEHFIEKLKRLHIPWYDANHKEYAITNRIDGVKQIWVKDPDNYWIEINNDHSVF